MACFLVPAAEAVITTVINHRHHSGESASPRAKVIDAPGNDLEQTHGSRFSWKTKLSWLSTMLWGGSGLLAIEHIWHGEVTFIPPFLTAMASPEQIPVMLHEMATVGVGMSVLVTAVWGVAVVALEHLPGFADRLYPAGQPS